MCTRYDPQYEAEAAMKRAAESEGPDRQRLIELALAWHQLARSSRRRAQGLIGVSLARIGLNYRWGAPVVAKY